jgi:hypothetical protein
MRVRQRSATELGLLLREKKACTLEELMAELGTSVRMTVWRKLTQLPYLTSYSDRGRYYALKPDCKFDRSGLWSHRHAWFSVYGTLLQTGQAFIDLSKAGYTVAELNAALHVQTQQALLHLLRQSRVYREKVDSAFVYVSMRQPDRTRQLNARRQMAVKDSAVVTDGVLAHELKAAIVLFFGLLDERQRRIFAGLESLRSAQGDAPVARLLGVDPHTVARGRTQLLQGDIDLERVRKSGGGRPSAEKKRRKSSPVSNNS